MRVYSRGKIKYEKGTQFNIVEMEYGWNVARFISKDNMEQKIKIKYFSNVAQ
jgi:hypothetical protein